MSTVGAYEAKTHLAALLDRVDRESTSLSRGTAERLPWLVQPSGGLDRPVEQVIADILDARRGRQLGKDVTVRDLISTGRR